MKLNTSWSLAVAAVAFGCADQPLPTSGADVPTGPSLSQVASGVGTGRYVMAYAGYDMPADAAAAIAAAGGTVDRVWTELGYGVVSGIDAAGAAAIGALASVTGIAEDMRIQWIPANEAMRDQMEGPDADTDQSGAFFFNAFQWNMRQIDADDAWIATGQGAGTRVAILDTGGDPFHIDLAGKYSSASASVLTPGSSPCGPFDEGTIFDLNFHGTFVGALVSSNGLGMASTAPDATLIAVKVLNCAGAGSFADVIDGIIHATASGANVINMSLGALVSRRTAGGLIDALQAAIDFATDGGVFVVASSGNEGIDFDNLPDAFAAAQVIHVPSMLDNVLSVGATAPIGQVNFDLLTSYTNFGQHGADVMAPGGDLVAGGVLADLVLSACSSFVCPGPNFFVFASGTSFASPLAAGTAAVVAGDGGDPAICVTRGADRILGRGNDHLYSRGRINVVGAAGCNRLTTD